MTEPLDPEEYHRPRPGGSGAVRVRVPAKINLHLGVGPLRTDGYHEVTTVYHAVSLHDEVSARRGDTLTLTMEGEGAGALTLGASNLVIKAATALARYAGVPPLARLHLRKQIPIAGGLAGGSADAAAALVACDALWGTGLTREELADVAGRVGSDVPFLVVGGTALGTGRGERVSPVLAGAGQWHWVLAFADGGLATPDVYRELDRLRAEHAAPAPLGTPDALLAALRGHSPQVLARALGNDLGAAALSLRPALRDVLAAGTDAGALAGIVSGSGPTCFFLARDEKHATAVARSVEAVGVARATAVVAGPVPGARII